MPPTKKHDPQLQGLSAEMPAYLAEFGRAIGRITVFGEVLSPRYKVALDNYGIVLESEARAFECGAAMMAEKKNYDSLIEGAEAGGFSVAILSYYAQLKNALEKVVSRIRMEGLKYLMDGVHGYSEKAAEDMEGLLTELSSVISVLNPILAFISEPYCSILEERHQAVTMRSENPDLICNRARIKIVTSLQGLSHRTPSGASEDERTKELFSITSDLMYHLGFHLGQGGLNVIGKKGDRPLGKLPGGPLEQLEFLLHLINVILKSYNECVVHHRTILSATI